jgi:cytochrome c oxidase subunit IV
MGPLMEHPIIPPRTYFIIYVLLLVLLVLTVAVAYVHLNGWSVVLALTIAIIKALLVILYFMHVRYSDWLTWLFAGAGFLWLGILLVLTISDYLSRGWVGG